MQKQWLFAGVFGFFSIILMTSCNRVGGQITRDYSVDTTALEEGTPLETAVHLSTEMGGGAAATEEHFTVIRDFGEPPSEGPVVAADSRSPDDAGDGSGDREDGEELGQPPQDDSGDGRDGDDGKRDYGDGNNKDKDDQPLLGKLKKDADFLACGDAKKVLKYFSFKEGKPDDNFYQWFKKNHILLQKKACLALKLKDQTDKIEEVAVVLYGSFQVSGSSSDDDHKESDEGYGGSLHLASWGGNLSTGTGPSGHFVVGTPHFYQVATGSLAENEESHCDPEVVSLASYHPSDQDCEP
ncbi:MAG: hypothetical protein HY465_05230 [Deltaproteobacteria bacterium]|nr:hypothetical protein [Deltaproteobacteria bacterium]